MKRLTQPKNVDKERRRIARELLDVHAELRATILLNDGRRTKEFYDSGIPVAEIAQAYGAPQSTVYAIIARQPEACHESLPPGDACVSCGEVSV